MNSIKEKLELLQQYLASHPQVTLVAVSKRQPLDSIRQMYDLGIRHFGENTVQEMVAKHEQLPKDICWHFIGHLQRNKVKYIAPFVHLVHAVDSLRLLKEIEKQAEKHQRKISCLLQMHIAQENTKFGLTAEGLAEICSYLKQQNQSAVIVKGLMGMATNTHDEKQVHQEFAYLKSQYTELEKQNLPHFEMKELSMGMTQDYAIAIEEGSSLIRVGSGLFGARQIV